MWGECEIECACEGTSAAVWNRFASVVAEYSTPSVAVAVAAVVDAAAVAAVAAVAAAAAVEGLWGDSSSLHCSCSPSYHDQRICPLNGADCINPGQTGVNLQL